MGRRDSATQELPGMEQPKDAKLENASRGYRKAIAFRLEAAKDEANRLAKLTELIFAWAEREGIKPVIDTNDKGHKIERYTYRRGDIEATATRPVKWKVQVKMGDEIAEEEPEGDADAVHDDDEPES